MRWATCAALFLAAWTAIPAEAAASRNFVTNGDFAASGAGAGKDARPPGWKHSPGLAVTRRTDPGGAYLELRCDEPATAYLEQTIADAELAGKVALLECDVRYQDCESGKEFFKQATASVRHSGPAGASGEFTRRFEGTSNWRRLVILCEFPAASQTVTVAFGFQDSSGTFCVRNVRLRVADKARKETPAPDVVEDFYSTDSATAGRLTVAGRVWYDVSDADPGISQSPAFTDADRLRGFVVYQRPNTKIAPAQTRPDRSALLDSGKPIRISQCPGETRSAVAVVYPMRPLPAVEIAFEPLVDEHGQVVAPDCLRADYVKPVAYRANWYDQYARMPRFLTRFDSMDLPAGNGSQFWIYCSVPEHTPGGVYRGKVRLLSRGQLIGDVPIEVRVYPFVLAPVPVHWSFFYYYQPDKDLPAELEYMRSLGMNSVLYSPPAEAVLNSVTVENGSPKMNFADVDRFVAAYKAAGYTEPFIYFPRLLLLRLAHLFRGDRELEYHDYFGGGKVPLLKNESDYPPAALAAYKTVIGLMAEHARAAEWPEVVLYLTDEPGLGSQTEWETAFSYRLAKEAWPGVKTACTSYRPEFIAKYGKYIDYVTAQGLHNAAPGPKNALMHDVCGKAGSNLWACEWPALFWNNYWYARAYAGFVAARSRFGGMNLWYFQKMSRESESNPQDPFRELRPKSDSGTAGGGQFLYRINSNGQRENSTILEGIREGILDHRYIATLRNAIAEAKRNGKDVSAYDDALNDMMDAAPTLPVQRGRYACDSPGLADAGTWTVRRNEELRMKIAEMIVEIRFSPAAPARSSGARPAGRATPE